MEPGSTFKIVVVSGALNDGVVHLNDSFNCEHGHFAYAGRILHDHEPFGILTTEGIITKSSNIGAAKIGIKLGARPALRLRAAILVLASAREFRCRAKSAAFCIRSRIGAKFPSRKFRWVTAWR